MENLKFLKIIIICLLLINLGTLAFIWKQKPQESMHPRQGDVAQFLTRELNLTVEQENKFDVLRNEHHQGVEILHDADRTFHHQLFDLLKSNSGNAIAVNALTDSIASNHKKVELLTFYHFQKVRAICSDEQKKKFDTVIEDTLRMMAPKLPPRK